MTSPNSSNFAVPNVTVGSAPIQENIVDDSTPSNEWNNWFSNVADSISGDWGPIYLTGLTTTATYSSIKVRGRKLGTTIAITLDITGLTATQGQTITLPSSFKFSAEGNVLNTYAETSNTWLITDGSYIEDHTITLPTVSASRVIISGFAIRKV